jgi:hypothetical protein
MYPHPAQQFKKLKKKSGGYQRLRRVAIFLFPQKYFCSQRTSDKMLGNH